MYIYICIYIYIFGAADSAKVGRACVRCPENAMKCIGPALITERQGSRVEGLGLRVTW